MDDILPILYLRIVNEAGQACTPRCCTKSTKNESNNDTCVWSNSTNAMNDRKFKKMSQWQNHKLLGVGSSNLYYLREEQYYCQKHDSYINTTQAIQKKLINEGCHLNHEFHKIGEYFFTEECCRYKNTKLLAYVLYVFIWR